MKIRKNKIKQYFREGKYTIGIWNGIPHGYAAEICAGAGFDWVLIDGEHAPHDLRSIMTTMQMISAHDCGIVVRPPVGDPVMIKQLLDAGAQTLLIPNVESAEQAKQLVAAMRYPPLGKRGVGAALSRAAQWKRIPDYYEHADSEMCLIVQVESVIGMKQIEAITAVDGVDGVFIGPADLSASMGHLGHPGHEDVKAEVKRGLSIIHQSGKVAGVMAVAHAVAQEYRDAGASFIGVGIDLVVLADATTAMAKAFRQLS